MRIYTNQLIVLREYRKSGLHNLVARFGVLFFVFSLLVSSVFAAPRPKTLVYVGQDGHLKYIKDEHGNRVPDYSYCGYEASENSIPQVAAKVFVPLIDGDATLQIQQALDYVATLPVEADGFRGAVQLEKGSYHLSGRLVMKASGVVLRGSGMGDDGTLLQAEGKDRQTFIRVLGKNDIEKGKPSAILDAYVPVNGRKVQVADAGQFKVGQQVFIHRPSTQQWIDELGMNQFGGEETQYLGWKPGRRDMQWDRTIRDIQGDTLILSAPLTTALDTTYGVSQVIPYTWSGRINHIGIENLKLSTTYDHSNPKDEYHCYSAITIENAENAWVRQVVFTHFAGSAVAVYETGRLVTVQDCKSLDPISEIGGWRRYTFFTSGQQTLFQRLYAKHGYHDFATGYVATGPNAFVQCFSQLPYSFSGSIDCWASGVLFDIVNVDGNKLSFSNRMDEDLGAGWTAANSTFWQCSAAHIENFAPPTAMNWSFGCWAKFRGNGYWAHENEHIRPRSLYYKQLADRLGKDLSVYKDNYMPDPKNATSSPTIEEAAKLSKEAYKPLTLLADWIMKAPDRDPISTSTDGAKSIDDLKLAKPVEPKAGPMIGLNKNGWIVRGNQVMTGERQVVPWWFGNTRPYYVSKSKPAITRYVPGRNGRGFTDNLDEVMSWMKSSGIVGMEQNYGLWYDRRRDDHERVRRMNGDVWAPFYTQPFARSGNGTAWDGLSKYDLTKYNNFYWSRLKKFADMADTQGRILINNDYFQHNILEAGAHWVDCPWRPVNNINGTDFPEPPPFAGDKRIFIAEQFYDETNQTRRPLHEAYIRQCLNNFKGNHSVIQEVGAEFTGPLHFVKFWFDVINDWEKQNGSGQMIGLSTTKDVQDSILADPSREPLVDVIDIRYWSGRAGGGYYAPLGGQHMAPRQHMRVEDTGKRSFESVYNDVLTYKKRYPNKAVLYSFDRADRYGWAIFMAGGSLANIPQVSVPGFLTDASTMQPVEGNATEGLVLKNDGGERIIYSRESKSVVDLSHEHGRFQAIQIDPRDGKQLGKPENIKGGEKVTIASKNHGNVVIWISKK